MQEMRLWKREIRDPGQIRRILEDCQVLHIGARDEEGMFIVPVNYGYEYTDKGEIIFYIHSAPDGRKARAFQSDCQVAVELDCEDGLIRGDYACGYSMAFRSIMGNGRISLVSREEEKRRGLELLMRHTAGGERMEFSPDMLQAVHVYRIRVQDFRAKQRKRKM